MSYHSNTRHTTTIASLLHHACSIVFCHAGVPPEKCAKGTEGHNTAQIGGFVMLPPALFSAMPQGQEVSALGSCSSAVLCDHIAVQCWVGKPRACTHAVYMLCSSVD